MPRRVIGHSGDLTDGGDRTLVWETPAYAANDDGEKAVAVIKRSLKGQMIKAVLGRRKLDELEDLMDRGG